MSKPLPILAAIEELDGIHRRLLVGLSECETDEWGYTNPKAAYDASFGWSNDSGRGRYAAGYLDWMTSPSLRLVHEAWRRFALTERGHRAAEVVLAVLGPGLGEDFGVQSRDKNEHRRNWCRCTKCFGKKFDKHVDSAGRRRQLRGNFLRDLKEALYYRRKSESALRGIQNFCWTLPISDPERDVLGLDPSRWDLEAALFRWQDKETEESECLRESKDSLNCARRLLRGV